MAFVIAHFSGKVFVPHDPVDLREGEVVELSIRRHEQTAGDALRMLERLPLIRIAPDDARAINQDSEFDVEEA